MIEYGTAPFGHVGDCAVYLSYDTGRPRRTMRWVKIANLPDCRSQINQNVPITIPAELPAGNAVLRWDQYALHQVANVPPFIEWFIQCADVTFTSSSTRSWESFNTFSIIDNDGTPAYPSSASSYRSPYTQGQSAPGEPGFWMTGPACVDDSLNQCALTAVGTKGYTGFGGEAGAASSPGATSSEPSEPAMPGPMPGPSPSRPTETPSPSGGDSGDAMCCFDTGCSAYGTSFCSAAGTWCSGSEEACKSCGGTLCVESAESGPVPSGTTGTAPAPPPPTEYSPVPGPMPAPVPGPAPAPVPAPSGSCISNGPDYYTAACAALEATCEQHSFCKRASAGGSSQAPAPSVGACVSNDANIDYSAACQALEATCEQFSFCKRASALAQASALHPAPRVVHQHKFLHRQGASGNILLQAGTSFEMGLQPNLASSLEDEL